MQWAGRIGAAAVLAFIIGAVAVLFSTSGCRLGVPVIDTADKPPTRDGTISGRVIGPADSTRLAARRVDAINVDTGARVSVTTASTGGFTLKVPPGTYRLSVELREGEALSPAPGPITINESDMDANIELVVSTAVARPRQSDSLRGTDGLGAPIAQVQPRSSAARFSRKVLPQGQPRSSTGRGSDDRVPAGSAGNRT